MTGTRRRRAIAGRAKIGEDQWKDPWVSAIKHQLAAKERAKTLPDAGGGGRVVDESLSYLLSRRCT